MTFSSCTSYTSNSQSGQITLNNVKNPAYVKTTDTFQVYIYTSANANIAQMTAGLVYTPIVGALSLSSASVTSSIISATTPITLTVYLPHGLTSSSKMTVTFPATYSVSSTCSITAVTSNVNTNVVCSTDTTSRTFTIFQLFSSTFAGAASISFTLTSVVLPPTTLQPTGL